MKTRHGNSTPNHWLLIGWVGLSVCLLLVAWWASRPRERLYEFRGRPLPGNLRPFGPQAGRRIVSEPDGLRITAPKDKTPRTRLGLNLSSGVTGNFVITLTFQILKADEPPGGFGVGTMLAIDQTARIGRFRRAEAKDVIVWDRWEAGEQHRRLDGGQEPCIGDSGRLRLKRVGSRLSFLWSAEPAGDAFQPIHECDFGTDDVKVIKLIAETEKSCALEARFLSLRVSEVPTTLTAVCWFAGAVVGSLGLGLVGWRWLGRRPESRDVPSGPRQSAAEGRT